MIPTLDDIEDNILAHLDSVTAARVEEHAIPDLETVPRDENGEVVPYVSVQFGDLIPVAGGEGFVSPLFDDYLLPVYLQAIASDPRESRRLANFLTLHFLGQQFPFSGSVRKRIAGAQFPMEGTDGAVEAYIWPLSFSLLVQVAIAEQL